MIRQSISICNVLSLTALVVLGTACVGREPAPEPTGRPGRVEEPNPLRNAYFGDLHVHTAYSFDAFAFGTRTTPDDAYRFAKGEAIQHPVGQTLQLAGGPLDFQAVADHAMFLGSMRAMEDPGQEISRHPLAEQITTASTFSERIAAFRLPFTEERRPVEGLHDPEISRTAWSEIIDAAERHYEPGVFTTFIGYEYTSGPDYENLHRNVIYRGDSAPEIPFSRFDSENPEDLWAWMDTNRERGFEAIAIPHNSNGSNGQMFALETFDGQPLDGGYAETRMRNEPIVEVSQVKGTSEVHPLLSPNDEWADFEIYPYRIGAEIPSEPSGGYVREAYLNGLALEENAGFNPYRFGLIGSTDTHVSAGTPEEFNFHSKSGWLDGTPELRGSVPATDPVVELEEGEIYHPFPFHLWGASGLAGVWAEENTREAIFDAMRRKETFATSGPRIRLRFFGGFDFDEDMLSDGDVVARAYADGVPMGGDLIAGGGGAPSFLLWATRDPNSAPLQRLQIVKGWVEDGAAVEKVFDVACSDGLEPDPMSARCPDNGARVDFSDCSISTGLGAGELRKLWTDPEFAADQRAFYYLRVLENPKCRWSTWDAIRTGVEPRPDIPATIQDRAWSSPIWYLP
jgi:hypothetical protein